MPLVNLAMNSHPPGMATRLILKLFLDRLVFVLCRLCSLGDVCVIIIILHFINVSFVSLGPHHGPAQNFGSRLREFVNRLHCAHLWLTLHNRHAQSCNHICQVASVCTARPYKHLYLPPQTTARSIQPFLNGR